MATENTFVRYNDEDLAEFREIIESKLDRAKSELDTLRGQVKMAGINGTDDTASRFSGMEDGTANMEKEYLSQMAGRQLQFIDKLEKALIRIENKTYGICRETKQLISKGRLRAVPHATLSIDAKKQRK